jgi:hypothetical protein
MFISLEVCESRSFGFGLGLDGLGGYCHVAVGRNSTGFALSPVLVPCPCPLALSPTKKVDDPSAPPLRYSVLVEHTIVLSPQAFKAFNALVKMSSTLFMPVVAAPTLVAPAVVAEKKPRKPRKPTEIHTLFFTSSFEDKVLVVVYELTFDLWFRQYARSEKPEVALRNWKKLTKVAHTLSARFMIDVGPSIEILQEDFDPADLVVPKLAMLKKLATADAKVKKEIRAAKKAAKKAAAVVTAAAAPAAPATPPKPAAEEESDVEESDAESENDFTAHARLAEARHLLAVHVQDLAQLQDNLAKAKGKSNKAVVQAAIDAKAALIEKAKAEVAAAEEAVA